MPTHLLDHINGSKSDNRLSNLREATKAQNGANTRLSVNNSSGYKGVRWHTAAKKWVAKIKINYKSIHLGLFTDIEDAAAAYQAAALKYFGEFAYKDQQ
jgi:hypothetical protein